MIVLVFEWIQELFTPLPNQLLGRTHNDIALRIKTELEKWLVMLVSPRVSGACVVSPKEEMEVKEGMDESVGKWSALSMDAERRLRSCNQLQVLV